MKRLLSPRLPFFGILAVAVYFAFAGGEYSILDARRAEAELEARQTEILGVRRQTDSLRLRMVTLATDDEALERFARERYGFIRDGEYLYRISEPEEPPATNEKDRPSIIGWLRGTG